MNQIQALRRTWRRSAQHLIEQAWRFVRLTALASIPSVVDLINGGKFDTKTLLTFLLPFAEVAWRQMHPSLTASRADAAPGTVTTAGGEDDGLIPVPEPVPTDNGPRPEDGDQGEVSQDPRLVVPSVEDVFDAPLNNDETVEAGA